MCGNYFQHKGFQPTLPARGATITVKIDGMPTLDFNPRSPHGERPVGDVFNVVGLGISTHAPRTGSDSFFLVETCAP